MTKLERGPFRTAIEALPVGGSLFVPLPDGMEMKLHQRRCSARKSLSQREGRKYATRRGEHEGRRGIWIERVS